MAGDVDGEVADGEAFGCGVFAAAESGTDARDEFLGFEGFADVVVGAGFEADDDVDGVGACGEHDDGHGALAAEAFAHVDAVHAGEHHVEEDEVGAGLSEDSEDFGSVGDVVDVEAFVAQDDTEHLREGQVVVDDEYACLHESPPPDVPARSYLPAAAQIPTRTAWHPSERRRAPDFRESRGPECHTERRSQARPERPGSNPRRPPEAA
ncbi:hypothetical protein GCM10025883_10250 [Mobilicoccus caccae]|uniref:Uncharacterized protein n=1 Tax=Mobilicoccus caccae TaxID=1859295 RepID=A0ABQ6IM20_9MICO|nr:hypothetical protein GCM10025883_10250 [Mobilicoccus caccae]